MHRRSFIRASSRFLLESGRRHFSRGVDGFSRPAAGAPAGQRCLVVHNSSSRAVLGSCHQPAKRMKAAVRRAETSKCDGRGQRHVQRHAPATVSKSTAQNNTVTSGTPSDQSVQAKPELSTANTPSNTGCKRQGCGSTNTVVVN